MKTHSFPPEKIEKARARYARFEALSDRYWSDASLRARIDAGDVSDSLRDLEVDLPSGIEARIVADESDVRHFVMPPDPNAVLSDEALDAVAGGKSAACSTDFYIPPVSNTWRDGSL